MNLESDVHNSDYYQLLNNIVSDNTRKIEGNDLKTNKKKKLPKETDIPPNLELAKQFGVSIFLRL